MHSVYFSFFFTRSWYYALGLLLTLLALLAGTAAHGRTVLELDASKQPVALADWGEYWIDARDSRQKNLTAEDVDTSSTIESGPGAVDTVYGAPRA